MTVTTPSPIETSRVTSWTPRQREVLTLLARGRTNREIAEELGISLDGAKWHVSEIITRLGVQSRDEAAEYWRHENGWRMRITRVAGFATSGVFKWAGVTALAAGVAIIAAMAIFALYETGSEGEEHAGGGIESTATVPAPATASPSVPASVTPAPSPIIANPTGEVVAGVPVSAMTFGAPGSLPVPLSVIVAKGCYQCDGPTTGFERVTLDANGKLKIEALPKPPGDIIGDYWTRDGADYLSMCTRGYCGDVGQISADAQTTIYRSTDGGVSWQALGTFDGAATVAATTAQGVLVNRSTSSDGQVQWRFQLLGSNQVLTPPAGAQPEFAENRLVGWRMADNRTIQALDGSTLVVLPDLGAQRAWIVDVSPGGDMLIGWYTGNGPDAYLGLMQGGKLTRAFKGPGSLSIGSVLTQAVAFGNVAPDGGAPLYPAMLDLHTGTVNVLELFGPVGSSAYDFQRNRIELVEPGPFLRVTGAGDCLNVRATPSTSAKVLGCYADTVLLRDLSDEQAAGGVTFHKVQTPSSETGWASKEFLAR